ncbi:uncharacterized protein LOC119076034 [Bradysia coprophila]|uniref:uncharacterized protein LOC119076034 n=1 Tax=Bradysia coprophila TaxID=38358 RepID=UPI00187DA8CE|nr:uncharacterized protein LOC119076034 [Bradysia coprophila]
MSLIETKDNSTLTKNGLVRKRRVFKMPLKERLAGKFQLQQEIHPLRTACQHGDCNKNVPQQRRLEINKEFWQMKFSDRYTFGVQTISRKDIKQRRRNTRAIKNNTFQYFLKDENGEIKRVCQTFYLTTLGFSKRNDSFIKTAMGNARYKIPLPRSSKRGSHDRPNRKDYECIVSHIRSYNPNVSHHRREHAPKKIYLPENLTITSMHTHFREENPHVQCSYYLYRRIVTNELNISFTKLGHEQCETCEEYDLHKKCNPTCDTCDLCVEFQFHKKKYTESRALYDKQRLLNTETKSFYSADLEKVIMLPRLEMFKEVIFSSRLSAYNHTFAPLGGYQNNPRTSEVVAVIWHEAISGRCKEDITSAFYNFLIHKRTVEEHVLWLDNCSSQNKNWTLFSFLVYMINSELIEATKIQLNYFEPGHTFMSADSFHFQVEKSLTEMNKVYDFNDFQTAVSNANSGHVTVIPMEAANFMKWQDCSSRPKRTSSLYMHEMVQVTAERGSFTLKCKKSFSSMEEIDLDFLQKKYAKGEIPAPPAETSVCGIHEERKKSILKLCSIFPTEKMEFWQNLAVNKASSKSIVSDGSVTQRKKVPRLSRQTENTVIQSNLKPKRGQFKKNTALVKQVTTTNYLPTKNQETKKKYPKTRILGGTSSTQSKKNPRRGRQAEEAGNTEKSKGVQYKTMNVSTEARL